MTQAELYANPCKICQQFKKINTLYGRLPPKNTVELKPWNTLHVDLICTYNKSIRQQKPGSKIIKNNVSLACMKMVGPATDWFEIVKVSTYFLNKVTGVNDAYIDNSSTRVSQWFNNTCLIR